MQLDNHLVEVISQAFPGRLSEKHTGDHKSLNVLQKTSLDAAKAYFNAALEECVTILQPFTNEYVPLYQEWEDAEKVFHKKTDQLNASWGHQKLSPKPLPSDASKMEIGKHVKMQKAFDAWQQQHQKAYDIFVQSDKSALQKEQNMQSLQLQDVLDPETTTAVDRTIQSITQDIVLVEEAILTSQTIDELQEKIGTDHAAIIVNTKKHFNEQSAIKERVQTKLAAEPKRAKKRKKQHKPKVVATPESVENDNSLKITVHDERTSERIVMNLQPPIGIGINSPVHINNPELLQKTHQDQFTKNTIDIFQHRDPLEWLSVVSNSEFIAKTIIERCNGNKPFLAHTATVMDKELAKRHIESPTIPMTYSVVIQRLMSELGKWKNPQGEYTVPTDVNSPKFLSKPGDSKSYNFNIIDAIQRTEAAMDSVLEAAHTIIDDTQSHTQLAINIQNGMQYGNTYLGKTGHKCVQRFLQIIERTTTADSGRMVNSMVQHATAEGYIPTELDKNRMIAGIAMMLAERAKEMDGLFEEVMHTETAKKILRQELQLSQ